ncbi:MAG: pentapeptide repeat-containing protein [Desulfobacterales bacterium]|nr:pentapeptide repeat-containing protein [Desulfobacterales bacterium]
MECAKRDVKFFVLDLGTSYNGFDNKKSVKPEFFDKIRDRKWSVVFEKPQNMMKWGLGDGRSWCGPYFVYLIEIQMERIRSRREYSDENTFEPVNSPQENKGNEKRVKTLEEILALHAKWLKSSGSEGEKADLVGMDLSFAQLRGVNLKKATLKMTKFGGADLRNANFYGADLTGASFEGADLSTATIAYANLYGADLRKAKLLGVNAHFASLKVADLRGADLRGAIFHEADLKVANLIGTNLGSKANLDRTNFYKAKLAGANLPANFYQE